MNRIEQPPARASGAGPDADDMDSVLRRHFLSEMPNPWPAPPRLKLVLRPSSPAGLPWRSRLTLAASVACLLLGSVWFAARSPQPAPNTPPNVEEATRRGHPHHLQPAEPFVLPASRSHR